MTDFGSRLAAAFAAHGPLCVGIDPHPYLLERWGLADSAEGALEFSLRVVEATAGLAGIVKPQVAFFERHGSAGYAALERVMADARAAGIVVIADAKRGDVGTSVEAYGAAWLTPGSPLEADALTVNPYQGVGSLDAVLSLAHSAGKGVFVLGATSNPEAAELQRSLGTDGVSVAARVAGDVSSWNRAHRGESELADSVGLVIGATIATADFGLGPDDFARIPILAPGFGHQGAALGDLRRLYGAASPTVIAAVSRSILSAGPAGVRDAIAAHISELTAIA